MWFGQRQASERLAAVYAHCPAKLNLFLHIQSRRQDGFHELETLMTPVSLYDTFEIRDAPGDTIRLTCRASYGEPGVSNEPSLNTTPVGAIPQGEDNLAYQAVAKLRAAAKVTRGAEMYLVKRTPAAAGLGGASSDAAIAMIAANRLWQLGWSRPRLAELAAELGSDMPLFVHGQPAIARGRGEILETVKFPRQHFVIVKPSEGLSTAEVYRNVDLARCSAKAAASDVVRLFRAGRVAEALNAMTNDLEDVARMLSNGVEAAFASLRSAGLVPKMSGSGTSCFGWTATARQANRCAARLRSQGFRSFAVATLSSVPPFALRIAGNENDLGTQAISEIGGDGKKRGLRQL